MAGLTAGTRAPLHSLTRSQCGRLWIDRAGGVRVVCDVQAVCCAEAECMGQGAPHPCTGPPSHAATDQAHACARAQEWLRGGHLFDKLEEMAGQHYSEQQASFLFTQARRAARRASAGAAVGAACEAALRRGALVPALGFPSLADLGPYETRPLQQPYARACLRFYASSHAWSATHGQQAAVPDRASLPPDAARVAARRRCPRSRRAAGVHACGADAGNAPSLRP